jgi:hypothetical protein
MLEYEYVFANGNLPIGTVLMWVGTFTHITGTIIYLGTEYEVDTWTVTRAEIPEGWAACDGTGGTPDLREKWIIGAGGSYAVGDQAGALAVEVPHQHSIEDTTGPVSSSHVHGVDVVTQTALASLGISDSLMFGGGRMSNHYHTFTYTLSGETEHTHPATGQIAEAILTVNNAPPSQGVYYIMRLS